MLNRCLDFSSLIEDPVTVEARKHFFEIFSHILSNNKQKAPRTLVSTEVSRLIVYR